MNSYHLNVLKVYLHSVSSRLEQGFFSFSITMFLKVVSDNCILIDLKVLKLKGIKLDWIVNTLSLSGIHWSGQVPHTENYITFT